MPSQYDGGCKLCQNKFKKGDQIHISKVNNEWVKCTDVDCFKEQGGKVFEKKEGGFKKFTSQKFPIGDAPKLFCLAEELLESFYKKRDSNGDGTISEERLPIEQEAIAIESIFRTLSQNFKPEAKE